MQLTRFYWCDERLMRPDGVVLQIGVANTQVANALKENWPTMRHVMVEASRKNAWKFVAMNAALAAERGPVKLWLGKKPYEHSTFGKPASCVGSEIVRGLTLASMLDEIELPEVDLLLCNCEGAEMHLLLQLAGHVGCGVRQACIALHYGHVQYYSLKTLDAMLAQLNGLWDMEFRRPQGLEYVLLTRK